jgi:hypothetical protein
LLRCADGLQIVGDLGKQRVVEPVGFQLCYQVVYGLGRCRAIRGGC